MNPQTNTNQEISTDQLSDTLKVTMGRKGASILPYRPSNAWMFATPAELRQEQGVNETKQSVAPLPHKMPLPAEGSEPLADSIKTVPSLMSSIEATVLRYRLKSAAHFALDIVAQCQNNANTLENQHEIDSKIKVQFSIYNKEVNRQCFRRLRRGRPTTKVLVRERGSTITLEKSLAKNFPPFDSIISETGMQAFWESNGKLFNWPDLATELKEHVIQYCISNLPPHEDYFHGTQKYHSRYYKPYPCEVIEKLGKWRPLFHVSTQVRAITIRLCMNGSLFFKNGLCITSEEYCDFRKRWYQLGKHYQAVEPDGVPSDARTRTLAHRYRYFPKQYPALRRYATFQHGIRKICLHFDITSFLHFFKVTTGGLDQYSHRYSIKCDIFQQLPHLNAIVIVLPWRLQDHPRAFSAQFHPPLFHGTNPCPRLVYRLLYERIAEELAFCKDVSVENLLDSGEAQRFWNLREAAVLSLKFNDDELKELYEECGGGIKIDEDWITDDQVSKTEHSFKDELMQMPKQDFWPPQCQCEVPCKFVFTP